MEEQGIIEEHTGPAPWVSNPVLAPKDNGDIRITIDMRQANKAIRPTNIPIPKPDDIKAQLSGNKIFSKLDFRSAFHQLELEEDSRLLTVFHGDGRLMRYNRLTMGSTPASGELTKALRPLFQHIKGAHIIHDDLIVAGTDDADHDTTLHQVCATIVESGMSLNLEKTIIGKEQIPWWGLIITGDGIMPDPQKVSALKHASPPKSKEELLSFLCMIQANKDFIPNLARKTVHLRQLTKKHQRFVWDKHCKKEFDTLKEEFRKDTLLRHFDPNLQTYIRVDAHKTGLSAILMQGPDEESAKPIAFASRATTPVESRYPQLDLEALAIDFGLRRFRFYLVGGPNAAVVITDHKPLESIFKNVRLGSVRTERIKLRHQDILYKIVWRNGKSNIADYLSRHSTPRRYLPKQQLKESRELEKTVWFLNYGPFVEAISMESIINETKKDITLLKLKKYIRTNGCIPKSEGELSPYKKIFDQLTVSDEGMILKQERIILPQSLWNKAIHKAHQGAHPGMSAMKRRLRSHFWFPMLNKMVEEEVRNCRECQMFTRKTFKDPIHPHKSPNSAWEKVNIDLFGPMPDTKHVLVVTDTMSRFPAAKVVPGTGSIPVLKALDTIYSDFGQPESHRTDNGPPFNSGAFTKYSEDRGIMHTKTFPYHPQANPAETFMKPLGKAMKAANYNKESKETILNSLLSAYRATPHPATGISPGDFIFRHGYRKDFPKYSIIAEDDIQQAVIKDHEEKERRADKQNSSRHRKKSEIKVGDIVYTRNVPITKFQPLFGPESYIVTEVSNGGAICSNSITGKIQRRHFDDIKPAPKEDEHLWINEEIPDHQNEDEGSAHVQFDAAEEQIEPHDRPQRERRPPSRLQYHELGKPLVG